MSQKVRISKVTVDGQVYLGVCDHPVNGMPGHGWSNDPDRVMNWLCDGFRFRFNQHRSKRQKYVRTLDGELLSDKSGKKALVPIGSSVEDISDHQARRDHSFLAALPMQVLQAPERLESTEWWAAVARRKTNVAHGRPAGAMPRFRAKGRCDQSFTCWFNGGKNAVFSRTNKRSGVVTIAGQNPTGMHGPDGRGLRWKIKIKVRLSQPIRAYTSMRVNWSAGELVFVNSPLPVSKRDHSGGAVGLDRGATRALAGSEGEFWDAPDTTKLDTEIKYHSKRMAKSRRIAAAEGRKFWESKRYQAHKTAAAKAAAKKARVLDDWRHRATTEIVRAFNLIGIEDLGLSNMTRAAKGKGAKAKRGLNRALTVAGLADIRAKLDYKADLVGTIVVGVNPAYTSQRCNNCRHTAKENRKSQAIFCCVKCGHRDNADTNAAKNILDDAIEAWARTLAPRGVSVRPKAPQGPATKVPAVAATKREPPSSCDRRVSHGNPRP